MKLIEVLQLKFQFNLLWGVASLSNELKGIQFPILKKKSAKKTLYEYRM